MSNKNKTKNELLEMFDYYLRAVEQKLDEQYDMEDIESLLIQFLTFLKNNTKYQSSFEKRFVKYIERETSFSYEAIQFCMYELRWSTVFEKARAQYYLASDLRVKRVMELVMESFSNDWDGVDMFEYYRKQKRQ